MCSVILFYNNTLEQQTDQEILHVFKMNIDITNTKLHALKLSQAYSLYCYLTLIIALEKRLRKCPCLVQLR